MTVDQSIEVPSRMIPKRRKIQQTRRNVMNLLTSGEECIQAFQEFFTDPDRFLDYEPDDYPQLYAILLPGMQLRSSHRFQSCIDIPDYLNLHLMKFHGARRSFEDQQHSRISYHDAPISRFVLKTQYVLPRYLLKRFSISSRARKQNAARKILQPYQATLQSYERRRTHATVWHEIHDIAPSVLLLEFFQHDVWEELADVLDTIYYDDARFLDTENVLDGAASYLQHWLFALYQEAIESTNDADLPVEWRRVMIAESVLSLAQQRRQDIVDILRILEIATAE